MNKGSFGIQPALISNHANPMKTHKKSPPKILGGFLLINLKP
jgi:hypothetical protein